MSLDHAGHVAAATPTQGPVHLVLHRSGAVRLRWWPGHLEQLQTLLDQHSFWAQGRSRRQLKRMLAGSQAVVSAWRGGRLVGFGRASSDWSFRAVLWDVVVASDQQHQGLGLRLVSTLLVAPALREVERVYLMTTNGSGFYSRLAFAPVTSQVLMLRIPTDQRPGKEGGFNKTSG